MTLVIAKHLHRIIYSSFDQVHAYLLVHSAKEDAHSRRRWRQVQYLAEVFWRRWIREYLLRLQARQKWVNPSRSFVVGDIVLVVDEICRRSS